MNRSTPRLQQALSSVRAALSHQPFGNNKKTAIECNNVSNESNRSRDEAVDNNQEGINATVGAEPNGIPLLDVASISVEGSQGHANEDRCVVVSNERFHLFAVMDGHGGSLAGDFLVNELFKTLDEVYDDGFDHSALARAMEDLDRVFCALATSKMDMSGACLLAVLLRLSCYSS
uniref:PPM-type phosphatase domain-containing protein n=1 Tax=Hyaloperonospora arabidopsidis (strain Emoy2) TaxID=559515 RepID=M4BB12_HYAAE